MDGRAEARLLALACSEPPEGRAGWTLLRLLADRMVELGHVEGVSYETVRRTLKKTSFGPTTSQGVGDPAQKERGVLVWRMEEVLGLYEEEPYDPLFPVVCFDERPCQLLADARGPLGPRPGGPGGGARLVDHEYERRGTAHVLMAFEPLTGWRRVEEVAERRRKQEFAEAVRRIAEEDYPQAAKVRRVVLDNLSTHTAAAFFYEAFPPEQARRLARRVELRYTPVHGSWPNMAEIVEISALLVR